MAYIVVGDVTFAWVPDGAGPLTVPSAQSLSISIGAVPGVLGQANPITVAGGDSPTSAQLIAAATAMGTALGNALTAAQIAAIQGWASGGN